MRIGKLSSLASASVVVGTAIFLAASSAGETRPGTASPGRPNILVILVDDLGYADVSTYFKGRIATPNIDRIGHGGAVFTQGYVSAPICSPSRAGLMTGRHQQRFGFEYNNGPGALDAREHRGLDPKERTVANILHDGGYRTGIIGKWHLGWNDEHYPTNRGFDYFWGFLTGQTNFIRPDAPEAVNAALASKAGEDRNLVQPYQVVGPQEGVVTGPKRTPVDLGDAHMTDVITTKAIEFMESSKEKPFFLYLTHNAPHTPLQTTRKYYDRFPQIADRNLRIYTSMVTQLDDNIGKVLDYLDRSGRSKNTIVVFLSDNGCAAYIPGICSALPLSGGKVTYQEGGVRVPFMMRWPGKIRPGTVYDRPVSSLDVMPTVVTAAGLPVPTDRVHDGFDLLSQLTGRAFAQRPPLFWRTQPIEAMRDGDWKYIRDLDGNEFLYNIRNDPREQRNLKGAQPERIAKLRLRYAAWQSAMRTPLWEARYTEYEFGGRTYKFKP